MTGLIAKIGVGAVFPPVQRLLPKLPSWAVYSAIAAVALFCGVLWHRHEVKVTIADAKAAQQTQDNAAWQKALAKEHEAAMKWKAGFDQQSAATVAEERKLNEKAVADDAAIARALSLRGPGAASASGCRQGDHTSAAAAPDRHQQAAAGANAAGSQVPPGDGQDLSDFAIVPWSWLVKRGQEFDDMRSSLQVIEDNDKKQRANWPGK